jgi:hypothetical protein
MFPSNLMATHIGQRGSKLSPRLWARLIEQQLTPDGAAPGRMLFDDFDSFPNLTLSTAAGQLQPPNGYHAFITVNTTVGSVRQLPATPSAVRLLTSTAAAAGAHADTILATNGNVGTMGVISNSPSLSRMLITEFRFRLSSVADSAASVFLGLGEEGLAATNGIIVDSAGHTLVDKDLIGFFIPNGDGDSLRFVYRKAGQALQTLFTYDQPLQTGVWYNAGFIYDPLTRPGKRLKAFVNNIEQPIGLSHDQIGAAVFPNGEYLAQYAAVKSTANNAPQNIDLDLWSFYQAG